MTSALPAAFGYRRRVLVLCRSLTGLGCPSGKSRTAGHLEASLRFLVSGADCLMPHEWAQRLAWRQAGTGNEKRGHSKSHRPGIFRGLAPSALEERGLEPGSPSASDGHILLPRWLRRGLGLVRRSRADVEARRGPCRPLLPAGQVWSCRLGGVCRPESRAGCQGLCRSVAQQGRLLLPDHLQGLSLGLNGFFIKPEVRTRR